MLQDSSHLLPYAGDLPPYLPFIDPDHFHEVSFFRDLEAIGYRTVLLGGTGGCRMHECVEQVKKRTNLRVMMHPASPGEIFPVDLVLFPAVMNSNCHFTRPFGSGAVASAMALAGQRIPFLPIAYFVMGDSTARWYSDAFLIRSRKVMVGYCLYAQMMGFRWVFLDYEDPALDLEEGLVEAIQASTSVRLIVSDELTPERAEKIRALGVQTIVTPSNLYEDTPDPVRLAREFFKALLAKTANPH